MAIDSFLSLFFKYFGLWILLVSTETVVCFDCRPNWYSTHKRAGEIHYKESPLRTSQVSGRHFSISIQTFHMHLPLNLQTLWTGVSLVNWMCLTSTSRPFNPTVISVDLNEATSPAAATFLQPQPFCLVPLYVSQMAPSDPGLPDKYRPLSIHFLPAPSWHYWWLHFHSLSFLPSFFRPPFIATACHLISRSYSS